MPLISGGGRFNGGTVTTPLSIDLTGQADAVALDVFGPGGGSNDLVKVTDGSGGAALEIFQAAGHGAGVNVVSFVNGSPVLYLDHEGSAPTADLLTVAPGGTTASRFNKSGYYMTRLHAAPADADLADGECAVWFDQTNGAAKLMVKAKQADGTVRVGALALA